MSYSAGLRGGTLNTRRISLSRLVLALAMALAAVVLAPSAANAFNVTGFNYSNSTLQANGHPSTTISFTRQGSESEDIRDVQVELPAGVFANPEAANPKCTSAQFNADACPASSYVGTVQAQAKALSLLDLTVNGTVNVLQPAAGSTDIATIGMTLRPDKICILIICAVPQKIFLKTGINIKTFDNSGLRTYTPGAPKSTTIGIPLVVFTPAFNADITMNSLKLTFNSRSGAPVTTCSWFGLVCNTTPPSGQYFMRQAGNCEAAEAKVTLVSYQNASSSATSSYTPTGCAAVPSTQTTATFTPEIQTSQTASKATFVMTIPEAEATIQHALPKYVDSDFPNGSGINLEALAGVTSCSETQLQTNACPASSIIGNATALSKYIPEGLTGPVYATGDVGNQVPIAVLLSGPRSSQVVFRGTLGVRGDTVAGTGRAYSRFDRIPQLPFSKFTLALTKPVYVNPPSCGVKTSRSTITQFSGQIITYDSPYTVSSCPTTPNTTITNGPPTVTTQARPVFSFSSDQAGSTFQCSMDGAPTQLCTSPFTSELLANGSHTFSVFAVNGTAVDPSPATYAFTVAVDATYQITPQITPSTFQAGAHPDLSADVAVSGGQPRSVQIRMPKGFNASLAAVPLCATANAAAGNCAANTKVGTTELTVSTFSGSQTGVGDTYLTDAPTANDAGGVAVKVVMPFGTFIAQAGAYLVNNGANQYLELRDFPTNINGTEFTVTGLKLNFSGANGFLTNPSQCVNDSFFSTSQSFSGQQAAVVTSPFAATGCAALDFGPSIVQTLSSTQAGTTSNVVANLDLPTGHSSIKNMTVVEPPVLGPNYPAFGRAVDMCPGSAATTTIPFNPSGCPAQAKVGTMTLDTPLLTTPLTGEVFLINKTPLPWFGVKFDQPGISVRLTGITDLVKVDPSCDEATDPNGFCQKQISVAFTNVPDVPITHVTFALNSGPRARPGGLPPLAGELLVLSDAGDTTCQPNSPARSNIDSYSGKSVSVTQPIPVTGC